MFARKYQRIAAEHCEEGAVFLEILGDKNNDTRVGRHFCWMCIITLDDATLLKLLLFQFRCEVEVRKRFNVPIFCLWFRTL